MSNMSNMDNVGNDDNQENNNLSNHINLNPTCHPHICMCQIISRLQAVRFFMGDYTFLTHLYSSIYLIGIAKKSWGVYK